MPQVVDEDQAALAQVGRDVLVAFPPTPGACVMMSALYAGRLRQLGHDGWLVGGALSVGGRRLFGGSTPASEFSGSDLD